MYINVCHLDHAVSSMVPYNLHSVDVSSGEYGLPSDTVDSLTLLEWKLIVGDRFYLYISTFSREAIG